MKLGEGRNPFEGNYRSVVLIPEGNTPKRKWRFGIWTEAFYRKDEIISTVRLHTKRRNDQQTSLIRRSHGRKMFSIICSIRCQWRGGKPKGTRIAKKYYYFRREKLWKIQEQVFTKKTFPLLSLKPSFMIFLVTKPFFFFFQLAFNVTKGEGTIFCNIVRHSASLEINY